MLSLEYKSYTLKFGFDARTSRGQIKDHKVWYIKVQDKLLKRTAGYGEVAPLPGLSIDEIAEIPNQLDKLNNDLNEFEIQLKKSDCLSLAAKLVSPDFPSIRFALETALLDLMYRGRKLIWENDFFFGERSIPVNGLIWMGDKQFMMDQIDQKLDQGFDCIKIKIGSLDFQEDIEVLKHVRSKSRTVMIRLDANGAFPPNEALKLLKELSKFHIHSIEQPIMAGQQEAMQLLCEKSPIPIALDEELIGISDASIKELLLLYCGPKYIVLKPTLLGGFVQTKEWIELAEKNGIGWWITSALESNIGLNAIVQFTGEFQNSLHQGLGTGTLYTNNIPTPLISEMGFINIHGNDFWPKDLFEFTNSL